jgi:hypothetical protein
MEPILPPLTYHGHLPEGIHDATLEQLRERFVINPRRIQLWEQLQEFLHWAVSTDEFSHAYIDGGFISSKASPADIDVILEPRASHALDGYIAIAPFFVMGFETIRKKYSVDLHFWSKSFPKDANDFRNFFQYLRPQEAAPLGLKEGAKKGIVRITL